MKYSASKLIKCSAAQIVYFKNRAEHFLNRQLLLGEQYQSKIIKDESLANIVADEMRGCYAYNNIEIFFCVDMIKNGEFYEIKSIFDDNGNETLEYPEWYLHSSLLQCAFYKSLILKMDGNILYTPKFRIKEGYKKVHIQINKKAPYYLLFGQVGKYEIQVQNPDKIIEFYKDKIEHCNDYSSAREFDSKYKFKEFDLLKQYFNYYETEGN